MEKCFQEEIMKRLFSLLVLFCFTTNAFAASGSVGALEKLIDDHQYAMTVEWDQTDKEFQEKETKKFMEGVKELLRSGKVTTKDLESIVVKKSGNAKLLEAMRVKFALLGLSSEQEILSFLQNHSDEFYHNGASWNGGVSTSAVLWTVGILAVLSLVVYMVWDDARCLRYEDEYYCRDITQEDCTGPIDDEHCVTRYLGSECGMFPKCQEYENR